MTPEQLATHQAFLDVTGHPTFLMTNLGFQVPGPILVEYTWPIPRGPNLPEPRHSHVIMPTGEIA